MIEALHTPTSTTLFSIPFLRFSKMGYDLVNFLYGCTCSDEHLFFRKDPASTLIVVTLRDPQL